MSDLVGQIIAGRYRVEAFIGRGGMAEVYKVLDTTRATHLAMKVLREDLAQDKVFIRRFKREAQTLAQLQHPSIVRFYGLEQEDWLAFMLMDFVEGESLRREIFRSAGPLSLKRVLEVMKPVCSALHYAHQVGMVHCDVKPGNIMVGQSGRVLLSDFGIARMADAATATMVGMGTPAYMAPELVSGKEPTPQTDIYALGVTLFEMLTGGERPFTGEAAKTTGTTAEKVRWEQVNLEPPSPTKWNSAISPQLEKLVLKCLAKRPGDRYQSTLDVYNALEAAVAEVEGKAVVAAAAKAAMPPPSRPVVAQAAPIADRGPAGDAEEARKRKIRLLAILGGAGALVAMGVCVALIWVFAGRGGKLTGKPTTQEATEGAMGGQEASSTPAMTAIPTPTNTAIPIPTSTFTPTPLPTSYGPANGSVSHGEGLEAMGVFAGVNLRDVYMEAVFSNPYPRTTGEWDFGFVFRHAAGRGQYRLVVNSHREWFLYYAAGASADVIQQGEATGLNRGSDDTNKVQLVVIGNRGYFILNDRYMDLLDLSQSVVSGDAAIGTGFELDHIVAGESTPFEAFYVQTLDPMVGPISGSLVHDADEYVEMECAEVDLADFVVQSDFLVPHEGIDWDIGLFFRKAETEHYRLTALTAWTYTDWTLRRRINGGTRNIQSGSVRGLKMGKGEANEITLIVSENWGFMLLNDRFIARFDLSGWTGGGDICAATGFYYGSEVVGSQTGYRDFTIRQIR